MESAIIFFISHSVIAESPAINVVSVAKIRRVGANHFERERNLWNRNRRNTPAVTRVEEWTNAETGVGAAIAAGSHLENGICALLVIAAVIIVSARIVFFSDDHIVMIFQ